MNLTRRTVLRLPATALAATLIEQAKERSGFRPVLDPDFSRHYVDFFNRMAPEEVVNYIPNARAWDWMKVNVPLFACPDKDVEQIYYFRWWTFRKHIKETPVGFLITEFLKPVHHAGEYNSLSCAFGHHVSEGRWIHDRRFVDQDIHFWLRSGGNGGLRKNFHQFSGWAAATLYDKWLVDGDREFLVSYLDPLLLDYRTWERDRLLDNGLFWQRDVSDGMEVSISGGRKVKNARPTINSYMYGNAKSISAIAKLAVQSKIEQEYGEKAATLKKLIETRLWNRQARFFETLLESGQLADVREEIGFTPWYFNLPDDRSEYAVAWKQLMDPKGFYAPYGPTTAEQRSPKFEIAYKGDDCQWNGPSWPFSTTITLKALANLLNHYHHHDISQDDYLKTFLIYTRSQHIKLPDGKIIPWIDEDLNPYTGEWLARAMKIRKGTFYGRGNYYNHSGYCDLVITGLVGLWPRADDVVEIRPTLPAGKWDWFCLDNVRYHGRVLSIVWDKDGQRFKKGKGLNVFVDGKRVAHSAKLTRVTGRLVG